METKEMVVGKIYFIDYGQTQIIGRFLKNTTTEFVFFDLLHYWNGYESFRYGNQRCIHSGIESMRDASHFEKMNLVRFELRYECI